MFEELVAAAPSLPLCRVMQLREKLDRYLGRLSPEELIDFRRSTRRD